MKTLFFCLLCAFSQLQALPITEPPLYGPQNATVNLLDPPSATPLKIHWAYIPAKIKNFENPPFYEIVPNNEQLFKDETKLTAFSPQQVNTVSKSPLSWYAISLTLPNQIDNLEVQNLLIVLNLEVDDFAEIWVNGKQAIKPGHQIFSGCSLTNRVVIANQAKAGDILQIAIFAVKGPLSKPDPSEGPKIHTATLELYKIPTFAESVNTYHYGDDE